MGTTENNEKKPDPGGRVEPMVMPDDEQMCCCRCGHIAKKGDPYEIESGDDEDFPVCPICGNYNVGGYSCYAPADVWGEDLKLIIELNQQEP